MKKRAIIILSIIAAFLTFVFSEIFSIYHFGSVPTLLTSLYLISIFAIFEYLSISITYVIKEIIKKKKIKTIKIIGLTILFLSLLLILWFVVVINIDWLNWYANSTPFYINIIVKMIKYLLPSIVLTVISIVLLKKKK